jgi:S1-C subfamily serine protease
LESSRSQDLGCKRWPPSNTRQKGSVMFRCNKIRRAAGTMICIATVAFALVCEAASLSDAIREVQPRMVKIYGAGGIRGLEAYQSGFFISAEGHIITAFSYVLDSDVITVALNDGNKLEAKLVGIDPRLEIAVLKVEGSDYPFFDLRQAVNAAEGTRVLAFSNLFGVATGEEAVSVLHGSVATVTTLAARRGAYETPYQGPVYVLDAMTNNPGAAGGALTDMRGQLLGLLGKELRNSKNNTWLNYALPANELVEAVEQIKAGKARTVMPAARQQGQTLTVADLGIVMVPNVLDRTPPYVDSVRPGSPAAAAGIQRDDLIVFVENQLVQSCNALTTEMARLDRDSEVRIMLMRNGVLKEFSVKANAD